MAQCLQLHLTSHILIELSTASSSSVCSTTWNNTELITERSDASRITQNYLYHCMCDTWPVHRWMHCYLPIPDDTKTLTQRHLIKDTLAWKKYFARLWSERLRLCWLGAVDCELDVALARLWSERLHLCWLGAVDCELDLALTRWWSERLRLRFPGGWETLVSVNTSRKTAPMPRVSLNLS